MTGTARAVGDVDPAASHPAPAPPAPVPPRAPEPWERAVGDAPSWPLTRLAASGSTVALALSVIGPACLGGTQGWQWLGLLVPGLLITAAARAIYETLDGGLSSRGMIGHVLAATPSSLLAMAMIAAVCALFGPGFSALSAGATAVLVALTLSIAGAIRDVEMRLRLSLRCVYLVGSAESRLDLVRELSRRHDARLVGTSSIDDPLAGASTPQQIVSSVIAANATVLVLDSGAMRDAELVAAASRLNLAGLRIRDLVSYYESEFKKVPLSELSPTWFLFDIAAIHRGGSSSALRRFSELVLAGMMLVLALPLLAVAAFAIRLTSPGPVLYRQRRVGMAGHEFMLLKLRTMVLGADEAVAVPPASLITPVGRFLRRFRLDELPQLWNVIRGDLALIGPRPEQVPIVERLERELPYYGTRHCIRPGITGWAQVTLSHAAADRTVAKLQRDLYYIKHSCLRLDALIVWLTIKTVFAGRG